MTAMGYSQGPKLSASKFTLKKTAQSFRRKLARIRVASIDVPLIIMPYSGHRVMSKAAPIHSLVVHNANPLPTQKMFSARVPTSSPNKFLEAINEIERAVANARASRVHYSETVSTKMKGLLERAISSKSYNYVREVLGQIMYLLSTKPPLSGRRKKSNEHQLSPGTLCSAWKLRVR